MKIAVRYGDKVTLPRVQARQRARRLRRAAQGGRARARRVASIRATSRWSRTSRSELVIPLLLKDRCIGVFDLESPELDAFNKNHVEILTLLASQAAVAIENARLYETIRANEVRIEKELRFAQRVQAALLPTELPKRLKAWTWPRASRRRASSAATSTTSSRPSRTASSSPSATCRARACRRRSTARLPASWCARARSGGATRRSAPARRRAGVDEHDSPRAPARGVLLHALLRRVRLQAADRRDGEFRAAVSDSRQRRRRSSQIELPGVPLGSFAGLVLRRGDASTSRRATCSCSAPTASSKRATRAAASSARPGCCDVVAANRAQARRARSWTRSSPRCATSAATRRPTTT